MPDRHLHSLTDDELLAVLGSAMALPAQEPPPAAIEDLRSLLAQRSRPRRGDGLAARLARRAWRPTGWRARLAVAGAGAAAVAFAGGTAFALGAPMPAPVRSLAYDLGLPVTPPAVVAAQDAARAVQNDLASSSATSQADTVRDVQTLAHSLLGLSPGERLTEGWPERVFAQACRAMASRPATPGSTSSRPVFVCTQSSASPTTPAGRSGTGGGAPGGTGGTSPTGRSTTPASPASNGQTPSGPGRSPSGSGGNQGQPTGGPGGRGAGQGGDDGRDGGGQPGGGAGGSTEGMRR